MNAAAPTTLAAYHGQRRAVGQIVIALAAYRREREAGRPHSFPHLGLWGPPGTGKTQLVSVLASELAVPLVEALGCSLAQPHAVNRLLVEASFTLMGVATAAMATVPSYARIGVAAPVLVVVARLVMGFSLGGEVGPTTAYLLETSPVGRRRLTVAWQGASQFVAAAAGGLVGSVLTATLRPGRVDAYG